MKKRIVALACAMTMATALLAGCGNSSKETKAETTAETTAESTDETAGESAAASSSDKKYAVILKTQATDFWTKMWKGVETKQQRWVFRLIFILHRMKKTLKVR